MIVDYFMQYRSCLLSWDHVV